MKLDPFQQKAAFHDHPFSFIIAGAGTGKTYTLLGRIQYLIETRGLKPEEILVISFTNETVNDFKAKAKQQLGYSLSVLTFHKLAILILNLVRYDYCFAESGMLEFITDEFVQVFCQTNVFFNSKLKSILPFYYGLISLEKRKKYLKQVQKDFVQLISLTSCKGISSIDLMNYYFQTHGKNANFFLLGYFIMQLYESEKESQKLLDFDDLIIKASKLIDQCSDFPYRHILIDEFQDSSLIRINLIVKLIKKFRLNFTLVGDDCQSIYSFSGTESNCFTILRSIIPEVQEFYLKYTYRNSQELIDIANAFVLKNPLQLKKEICSPIHIKNPIEILYYRSPKKILIMLQYIISNDKNNDDILFLGRNSFDWKYYFNVNEIHWFDSQTFSLKHFPNKKFRFLTVHRSKGLEASIIIVLHVSNEIYGFPNKVKNSCYLHNIVKREDFPFGEERRLFYVALTRAIKKVYLIVPSSSPSFFVKELISINKKGIKKKYF